MLRKEIPNTAGPSDIVLTEAVIRRLKPPPKGSKIYYDKGADRVPGLAICITYKGGRSWTLDFSDGEGRRRRGVIAAWPEENLSGARKEARKWRVKMEESKANNPIDALRREEQEKRTRREEEERAERTRREEEERAKTIATIAAEWMANHAEHEKRPSSRASDASILRCHILPRFGNTRAIDLRRSDILSMKAAMKDIPVQFNRTLSLLITLLRYFDDDERDNGREGLGGREPWKKRGKRIKGFEEQDRRVSVNRAQLDRLYAALESHPNKQSANAVKLAVWTGARRGEILGARWSEIDLDRKLWTRPSTRTKQKRDSVIPLDDLAVAMLRQMRESSKSDFLFPGNGKHGHQRDLKRFWRSVCRAAELPTLHFHDCRHVFASAALEHGGDLDTIKDLLGQASTKMARVYAEWSQESRRLRAASNAAVAALAPPAPAN